MKRRVAQEQERVISSAQHQAPAPQSMEDLLDQAGGWKNLRQGEIVEGVVMRIDQDGVLVSVGGKSEGLIPPQEMRSLPREDLKALRTGDPLLAYVLHTEHERGPALLSLDRAHGERGWRLLESSFESGARVEGRVIGHNKGGIILDIEGVQGFVPLSHLAPGGSEAGTPLEARVGRRLQAKVLEVSRQRNRAILSERAAWQEQREAQKERLLRELREGEVRKGRVSGISRFGAFVDLGGADGLIHVSELAWHQVKSPEELVKVGDEVEVYILKVDAEQKKISLSLRRLQPEPWSLAAKNYQMGQLVTGTVTRLTEFGAFARIEGNIEGLIHVSELSSKPVQHPKQAVKEGDVLTLKVLGIDPERRRLGLSLKQAQEEL